AAGWSFEEIDSPVLREIAARFEKLVRECGFTFVDEADRPATQRAQQSQPVFSNLLVFGFDAAHWPLWPLLRAATLSSIEATVILNDPRDEARDLDETWVGTWEETFGAAEIVPATNELPTTPIGQSVSIPTSYFHFVVGRDTTHQARAIVALAAKFLSDPRCDRLGILFSGPGALARLVATFLQSAGIVHNDAIAHLAPSAFDDDAWRAWLELQQTPRLKPLFRFLRATEGQTFDELSVLQIQETLCRGYKNVLIDDIELLRDYCESSPELRHGNAVARELQKIRFLPESASLAEFLSQTRAIFSKLGWKERWNEVERFSR